MEKFPSQDSLDSLIATYTERGEGLKLLWTFVHIQHDLEVTETEDALKSTPQGHPRRNECLEAYSTALENRIGYRSSIEDMDRAIEARMEIARSDGSTLPSLSKLGYDLALRFERNRVTDDIERAFAATTDALHSSEPNSPNKALFLYNMASTLTIRFGSTEQTDDLNRAIDLYEEASHLNPDDDSLSIQILVGSSDALALRYFQSKSQGDLDRSITAIETAIESADIEVHTQLSAFVKLSILLNLRWRETETIGDLERLIDTTRVAVNYQADDFPDRPNCLDILGSALLEQFERTQSLENLNEAIACFVHWLKTAQDRPIKAVAGRLASALLKRFERTSSEEDLDLAISVFESILEIHSHTIADRHSAQIELAGALSQRFQLTGAMADLERASKLALASFNNTAADQIEREECLNTVANIMHLQFERGGSLEDIDKEITLRNNWSP